MVRESERAIGILGAGYVGCVTAACLAKRGRRVVAFDTDEAKVRLIASGRSPVLEPGLDELVAAQVKAGTLTAEPPSREVLAHLSVAIVCVSTPSMPDGSVDVRPLRRALASLVEAAAGRALDPLLVVVRSTIAPNLLRGLWAELDDDGRATLRLVVNPELLRETTAIADFEAPAFQLYGSDDRDAAEAAAAIFAPLDAPRHLVDVETALLVKYASNAFHAVKTAFANEIGVLSDALGADANAVMSIFATDATLNISKAYLRPGFAFGGSCLPKDVRGLVSIGRDKSQPLPLLDGVLRSNADRIEDAVRDVVRSGARRVALLGLSFKRGTDDLRESPYLLLGEKLIARGLHVRAFDPDVDPQKLVGANLDYLKRNLPDALTVLRPTLDEALDRAEAIVVCKWVGDRDRLRTTLGGAATGGARIFDIERLLARAERSGA